MCEWSVPLYSICVPQLRLISKLTTIQVLGFFFFLSQLLEEKAHFFFHSNVNLCVRFNPRCLERTCVQLRLYTEFVCNHAASKICFVFSLNTPYECTIHICTYLCMLICMCTLLPVTMIISLVCIS